MEKWYVMRTVPGKEQEAGALMERTIDNDLWRQWSVLKKQKLFRTQGKLFLNTEILFPGYIFIKSEYPDKLQLRMMCSRIYENVLKNEKLFYGTEYAEMLSAERRKEPMEQDLAMPSLGVGENWLRDMIEVMLYQQLYRRRCDHRRCQRRFY